jgi:hypothetical protein
MQKQISLYKKTLPFKSSNCEYQRYHRKKTNKELYCSLTILVGLENNHLTIHTTKEKFDKLMAFVANNYCPPQGYKTNLQDFSNELFCPFIFSHTTPSSSDK